MVIVIDAVNVTGGSKWVDSSSEGMGDSDGSYLCTVEVDHVTTATGFGYLVRLQDVGYRDIPLEQAKAIGARLHELWLQRSSTT